MGFEGETTGSWDAEMCTPIFDKLKHKVAQLSIQKFSSNVIEKCLEQCSEESRMAMIAEIGRKENVAKMILDQYANYGKA